MSATAYDVVVAGGGVVGLLTAALLADADFNVCVLAPGLDRSAASGDIGLRTYALTPASRAVLEFAGAWQRLDQARIGPFAAMDVWDAHSSGRIRFESPPEHPGSMGWIVEHQNLVCALAAAAAERRTLRWRDSPLQTFEAGQPATVTCGDGERLRAHLIVGADGADSRVRDAAGIAVLRRPYQQRALVCNVKTTVPHGAVARQRFLATGPLALLPLAGAHRCAIVWSCDESLAARLEVMDAEELGMALTEASCSVLGNVDATGPRAFLPLERAHAEKTIAGACVLLGDAAHVVHPLAGQGLNLGILDAAALRDCLGAGPARTAWPPSAALRRFERWRKSEALALTLVTDGLQRLFQREERVVRALRGAGMRITDRATPLKDWLIARAMGLAGDVPELARAQQGARDWPRR